MRLGRLHTIHSESRLFHEKYVRVCKGQRYGLFEDWRRSLNQRLRLSLPPAELHPNKLIVDQIVCTLIRVYYLRTQTSFASTELQQHNQSHSSHRLLRLTIIKIGKTIVFFLIIKTKQNSSCWSNRIELILNVMNIVCIF